MLGRENRAPDAGRARAHEGDHGAGDAGRRDGHDDRAHLSAVELCHDRRADRDGEGRRPSTAASTPATFAAKARKSCSRSTEAIEIGEKAGLPSKMFHLKVAHSPGWGTLMKEVGQLVETARGRGVDVAADIYVYTAGGTGLEATIPSWAHEGGRDGASQAAGGPRDPRAAERRDQDRIARLVEHRRSGRRMGRHRAGQRAAIPTTRGSKASA